MPPLRPVGVGGDVTSKLAAIRTTEWMLAQWGRWAYHRRGLALDYPGVEPFTRMRGSVLPEPAIADDQALTVDRAVCRLAGAHPGEGRAVVLYYLVSPSYRRVGRLMGCSDKTAASLVRAGTMFVDGVLTADH